MNKIKSLFQSSKTCLIWPLILPLVMIWLEMLNAFYTGFTGELYLFIPSIFAAAAAGTILSAISFASPDQKINKWICFGLSQALCLFYGVSYFSNRVFGAFMSPKSMLIGGGGVITEFGDVIIEVLTHNMGKVFMLELPALLVLALVLKYKKEAQSFNKALIACLLLAAVTIGSVGACAMQKTDIAKEKYTYGYNYDSCVRAFGIATGVRLDLLYAVTGTPEAPVIEIEEPEIEEEIPEEPGEIVYGFNALDIDYKKIAEEQSNSKIKKMLTYIASQPKSRQNQYTGLFEGKNLVFITAESFSNDLLEREPDLFPVMNRMYTKGIRIEEFYQPFWGASTTTGEASIMMGLVPTDGANTIQTAVNKNNYYALGSMFQNSGYYTVAYHNGHADYYNRDHTHEALGYYKYMAMDTGMEEGVVLRWPESDLEMMQFTADKFSANQPFQVYYMSISGHGLYNFGGHQIAEMHQEKVKDLTYSTTVNAYFAANLDLEFGIAYLVDYYEQMGILDDTVFVIVPDHYPYALQPGEAWKNYQDYLYELYGKSYGNPMDRDHNCFIIWSPCIEEMEEQPVVTTPTYSVDIIPTLLNLFGIEYDSRLYVGRDVLSESLSLAIWPNGSWKTERGFYNADSGRFTPEEGYENTPDSYIQATKDKVSKKIEFSRNQLSENLYQVLQPYIEQVNPIERCELDQ